MDYETNI